MILLEFKSEPDFRRETVIWKMSLHVPHILFVFLGMWMCEFLWRGGGLGGG